MGAVMAPINKQARRESVRAQRDKMHPFSSNEKSLAQISTQYPVVMIWYLLYPFRGTTDPPILGSAHPLRRIFTRYGREAARHPVITLLVSVAVAAILIYPFPYLYTNDFTNGSSNLPHHVWTAAQPFEGDINTPPDVVMRSVWVHGSHMKALDTGVLRAALEVQDELLGPTVNFNPRRVKGNVDKSEFNGRLTLENRDSLHAINGLSNNSWFFNSPLLYWSCSFEAIAKDNDIIATVNEGSRRATSVNVTLRHSIVFSGKRFEDHRLVAADAIVITLIHKRDSPVGRQWERKSETLAKNARGRWRVYPEDGRVISSHLYEFRFQPLSFQDDIILGVAYSLTFIYFLLSLTRLRALKSRFGLSAAVITQIALSIMSSFTICAIFKIDLSKIPREAYPLVVLIVGLENMFRLINAVITTPSESPTALRIAEGLGRTGHIALAGVAQNLVILWLLYQVVSPGVAAFCLFAAMALMFDFIYLLTFFVAVLSVEVRRTELSDSISRSGQRSKSRNRGLSAVASRHKWMDALLRGELPVSTRVSGSIVLIGFVLIAQWHFFDSENPMKTLSRILQLFWADHKLPSSPPTVLAVDINQARTPTAWLRHQDHETAREVINVIKPNAHSLIARVYDPLVLVLKGSDRTPSYQGVRLLLPAAYDFVKYQTTRFVMTVLFIVAAVSLLMNFLLWGEEDLDADDLDDRTEDDPLLAVKTLSNGHALDIVMLAASPDGVIVSIGLDRWIRVWDIRQEVNAHLIEIRTRNVDIFPVLAVAIDDHANWVAFLSASGQVMLWHIPTRKWGPFAKVDVKGRSPLIFSFTARQAETVLSITLVQSNGVLTQMTIKSDGSLDLHNQDIYNGTLTCASSVFETSSELALKSFVVTASRKGSMYVATQLQDNWVIENIDSNWPGEQKAVLNVYSIPTIRSFLAIRQDAVDLLDMETLTIINTFTAVKCHASSIQCFYSTRRTVQCGSNSLAFFSLAYTERESGDCILRTYSPRRQGEVLCISSKKCSDDQIGCSWGEAIVQEHRIENPGKWITLPVGIVIGVRKRPSLGLKGNTSSLPTSTLRRRSRSLIRGQKPLRPEDDDTWEAWMLSPKGESATVSLSTAEDGEGSNEHLLVSSCGPLIRVGQRSIAVGMGNVVKIITVGNERLNIEDNSDDMVKAMSGRRRRPVTARKRSRGHDK